MTNPESVLHFWFEEIQPAAWWKKDAAFDALIVQRFGAVLDSARAGELHAWRESAAGALAEIIVLDQFSRNIFRDSAAAFAQDTLALVLAQEALRRGLDMQLAEKQRHFLYMPYMHSESRAIHAEAVQLFTALGDASVLDFEMQHKAIIDRFGRYPHRNAVLGRVSTAEEIAFLATPGSSF
ncbi:conserved protein of unknown function [Georgfuchsia toluolica]|uniref:DUF924 domain-containing protein n=1 Tax=Georgfuchsia toluolica TaxID=424218 RepID=A0A916N9Z9_9PROT|nr:DUF924 family protein [Georgfuchsia toluolica]CAG4885299.1 conserved protein of unknown function [Georgfuchsia toluolica]